MADIEPQSRTPSPIDAKSEEYMPIKREPISLAADRNIASGASFPGDNSMHDECGEEEAAVLKEVESWLKNLVDGNNERVLSVDFAYRFGRRLLEALGRRLHLSYGSEPSCAKAHICELERRITDVHEAGLAYTEAARAADCAEMDRLFDLRAHSADQLREMLHRLRYSILAQYKPVPSEAAGVAPASRRPGASHPTWSLSSCRGSTGTAFAAGATCDVPQAVTSSSAFSAVRMKTEPTVWMTGAGYDSEDGDEKVEGLVSGQGSRESHLDHVHSDAVDPEASGIDPYACLFSDDEVEL